MEEAGKVFKPQAQPLRYLRKVRRILTQVSVMPHMFQGTRLAGFNPGRKKSKLVGRKKKCQDQI